MKRPKKFISIALLWAWASWAIIIWGGWDVNSLPGILFIALGGISPTIAACYLVYKHATTAERKDFLKRIFDIKRIKIQDLFIIIFLPFFILFSAIVTAKIFGNYEATFTLSAVYGKNLWYLVPFALIVFLLGPLPEEIGWREYLLDSLAQKISSYKASVVIAIVWSFWHVPLFFIKGYPLHEKLYQPAELFIYFAMLFPKSLVYTWLYFRTERSIAAAILFHFFINFYGMLWFTPFIAELIMLLLWTMLALIPPFSRKFSIGAI